MVTLSIELLTGNPGPRISQDISGSKNHVILRSGKLLSQKKTLDCQPNQGLNKRDSEYGYNKSDAVTLSLGMSTGPRISQDISG